MMNMYPTEDGFKDEREEPNEEHEDNDGYGRNSAYNDVNCPVCFRSCLTITLWTDGDIAELQDECMFCEWVGMPYVE